MHTFIGTLTTLLARAGMFHHNRLSNTIPDVTFNILHIEKFRVVRSSKDVYSNLLSIFCAILFWHDPQGDNSSPQFHFTLHKSHATLKQLQSVH